MRITVQAFCKGNLVQCTNFSKLPVFKLGIVEKVDAADAAGQQVQDAHSNELATIWVSRQGRTSVLLVKCAKIKMIVARLNFLWSVCDVREMGSRPGIAPSRCAN